MTDNGVSVHYFEDRQQRESLINEVGEGRVVDSFLVDHHHKDGKEIHNVTDTGIVIIQNYNTKIIITKIIARPNQIRRLYSSAGKKVPRSILRQTFKHTLNNMNER